MASSAGRVLMTCLGGCARAAKVLPSSLAARFVTDMRYSKTAEQMLEEARAAVRRDRDKRAVAARGCRYGNVIWLDVEARVRPGS